MSLRRFIQDKLDNHVIVDNKGKLPQSVGGVITLLDNATYYIVSNIDLLGDRLVLGQNTTILGTSSENASITSTGLGSSTALITGNYTFPLRNITIKDVGTALDLDGSGSDMALDWYGVNFLNVTSIGTIANASNFIYVNGAFLQSQGLEFDGTFGTIAFDTSLFIGDGSADDIIRVLSTATISTRFRIIYSSVVANSSTTGINFDVSASIPVESYILDTVNFSGSGTYLSGLDSDSNYSLFINCKGIENTREVSLYYMNGNATATTISAKSTPVKVAGTTTSDSVTSKFTNTDNKATYTGTLTRFFRVSATLSVSSGNNNQVGAYIAKNGTVINSSEVYGTTNGNGRFENITVQTIVSLSTNDYIEIFVENATATNNITVTDMNVIIN